MLYDQATFKPPQSKQFRVNKHLISLAVIGFVALSQSYLAAGAASDYNYDCLGCILDGNHYYCDESWGTNTGSCSSTSFNICSQKWDRYTGTQDKCIDAFYPVNSTFKVEKKGNGSYQEAMNQDVKIWSDDWRFYFKGERNTKARFTIKTEPDSWFSLTTKDGVAVHVSFDQGKTIQMLKDFQNYRYGPFSNEQDCWFYVQRKNSDFMATDKSTTIFDIFSFDKSYKPSVSMASNLPVLIDNTNFTLNSQTVNTFNDDSTAKTNETLNANQTANNTKTLTEPASEGNTGVVVGTICGVLGGILLAGGAFYFIKKRRAAHEDGYKIAK